MTSRTRYNASQVLGFLFNNPEKQFTQRELLNEVSLVASGSTPVSDAVKTLINAGYVERTTREGKEAVLTLV